MKNRNLTIDACKGMAILLVMFGHVLVLNHMEDPYIYDVIKVIQMPFFMVVSGFLCGMGRRASSLSEYGQILKRRAVSYLVPFFFWIVLQSPEAPFSSIWGILFDLQAGLWFLMTLFVLTVMVHTAQLAAALTKRRWVFAAVYLLLAGAVAVQSLTSFTFLSPGLTRLYIPFYMAGYVTAVYKEQLKAILTRNVILAGSFVCATAFLYLVITKDLNDVSTLSGLLFQTLASFLGCILVTVLLISMRDGKAKHFLAFTGTYSLELYVLHFHFARFLYPKNRTLTLYSLEGVCFVLLAFLAMTAITAALIWLLKKWWVTDLLFFGKVRQRKKTE